jgi:hypothetical protein
MLCGDFANQVRRECQYGTYGVNTDQATIDILARINLILQTIWAAYDWPWSLEPLSIPITPGIVNYLVSTASGNLIDRITDLLPQDPTVSPPVWGPPLQQIERQDFFAWEATAVQLGASLYGPNAFLDTPTKYVNLGLDPAGSGYWQIQIAPASPSVFTMRGFGKKCFIPHYIQDIISNAPLGTIVNPVNSANVILFPGGILDACLMDGVKAGIYEIKGAQSVADNFDKKFQATLAKAIKDQANAGHDDSPIAAPPPDYYRWAQRGRSGRGSRVL